MSRGSQEGGRLLHLACQLFGSSNVLDIGFFSIIDFLEKEKKVLLLLYHLHSNTYRCSARKVLL